MSTILGNQNRIIELIQHCHPAVLEQRTGRVDRIGSKTFREREAAGDGLSLEVGVPFLAGTYDERMFEELRMRAQTFEVLTGGDVAIDGGKIKSDSEDVSGADDAEGSELGLHLKSLPQEMLQDLRAKLHVWLEKLKKARSDKDRAYAASNESQEGSSTQPQQFPMAAQ